MPKPGVAVREGEIAARCRELIGSYKVLRSMDFRAEALPKSGAGKILKRELRKPYRERAARQVS